MSAKKQPAASLPPAEQALVDAGFRRADHDLSPKPDGGPDRPRESYPVYERHDGDHRRKVILKPTDVCFYNLFPAGVDDFEHHSPHDLTAVRKAARRPVVTTTDPE
jgi:hypothetical protein